MYKKATSSQFPSLSFNRSSQSNRFSSLTQTSSFNIASTPPTLGTSLARMDNDWSSDWPSDYWSSDTDLSSLNIDAVYDNPDIGFLFWQLQNTDERNTRIALYASGSDRIVSYPGICPFFDRASSVRKKIAPSSHRYDRIPARILPPA